MHKIIECKINDLKNICLSLKVKRLYAFGSVVSGNFNDKSDIVTESTLSNPYFIEYQNNKLLRRGIEREIEINRRSYE